MKAWTFLTAIGMFLVAMTIAGKMGLLLPSDYSGFMKMLLVAMVAWFVPSPLTGRIISTPGAPPTGQTGPPTTRTRTPPGAGNGPPVSGAAASGVDTVHTVAFGYE